MRRQHQVLGRIMWHCLGEGEHVCDELSSLLTLETWRAEEPFSKEGPRGPATWSS